MVSLCDSAAISPVTDIEKDGNINDLLFKKMWFTPQRLSTYDEGYLLIKDEMQNLLDSYRGRHLIVQTLLETKDF